MPVVGDEHVEVRPVFMAAHLVEMRRDLPEVRHGMPKLERHLEEVALGGRRRDLHAAAGGMAGELRKPLALLAMVVREEHPLDL